MHPYDPENPNGQTRPQTMKDWKHLVDQMPRYQRDRIWPGMHKDLIPAYEMIMTNPSVMGANAYGQSTNRHSRHEFELTMPFTPAVASWDRSFGVSSPHEAVVTFKPSNLRAPYILYIGYDRPKRVEPAVREAGSRRQPESARPGRSRFALSKSATRGNPTSFAAISAEEAGVDWTDFPMGVEYELETEASIASILDRLSSLSALVFVPEGIGEMIFAPYINPAQANETNVFIQIIPLSSGISGKLKFSMLSM